MKRASAWSWRAPRTEGIWRHGCAWARPFTAAVPWITLALLLVTFGLIDRRLAAVPALAFDLPSAPSAGASAAVPSLVAFVVPLDRAAASGGSMVFFDDARYRLADETALAAFRERLAARVAPNGARTLLVVADRDVRAGELMRLTACAREAGVRRVEIAEKTGE